MNRQTNIQRIDQRIKNTKQHASCDKSRQSRIKSNSQHNQSVNHTQQRLLDEILRGSNSHVSQSYLTNVVKEKVAKSQSKFYTDSFTTPETLQTLCKFVKNECSRIRETVSLHQFAELLEQLELKEIELKIHIFSDLRALFIMLSKTITQRFVQQEIEIHRLEQLCDQKPEIFTLRQQETKPEFKPQITDSSPVNKFYSYYPKKTHPKIPSDFSIDLKALQNPRTAPLGYQEEFMANINEFSESWRVQALREQRC